MPDAFSEFLAEPAGEAFVRLRAVVVGLPEYDARSDSVTHIADEYDLLDDPGKDLADQQPTPGRAGFLDRITCTDGTELWFDLGPGTTAPERADRPPG